MTSTPILLMLADVDGTLVAQQKVLTDRAIEAVHRLHAAGRGGHAAGQARRLAPPWTGS